MNSVCMHDLRKFKFDVFEKTSYLIQDDNGEKIFIGTNIKIVTTDNQYPTQRKYQQL